jgi:hypothetical protein
VSTKPKGYDGSWIKFPNASAEWHFTLGEAAGVYTAHCITKAWKRSSIDVVADFEDVDVPDPVCSICYDYRQAVLRALRAEDRCAAVVGARNNTEQLRKPGEPCEKCDRVDCNTDALGKAWKGSRTPGGREVMRKALMSALEDCDAHAIDWRARAFKAEEDHRAGRYPSSIETTVTFVHNAHVAEASSSSEILEVPGPVDTVPRRDERIRIDGLTYIVDNVEWDVNAKGQHAVVVLSRVQWSG